MSLAMPVELIHFRNVKRKYCLNEDILLEYVLDAEVGNLRTKVTRLSTFRFVSFHTS
jgi:hypothetical protein